MKVFGLPEELENTLPGFDFNQGIDTYTAAIERHKELVKAWLIDAGYDGENTGRIYQTPVADGYAEYMFADRTVGRESMSCLIHLPYGDGWNARDIEYIPEDVILERIEQKERQDRFWAEEMEKRRKAKA